MKKTIKELKNSARGSLLGHYGTVIAALLFSQLIVLLFNIPFNRMTQQGIYYMVPSRIALGAAGTIIVSLLSSLLEIGIARIHLQIARRQQTGLREIFYGFQNRPDKFLGYSALLMILSLLCLLPGIIVASLPAILPAVSSTTALTLSVTGCILCVIGCIILIVLILAWALTPYLLLDYPGLRVQDAMKQSKKLMRGNKWRLFLLYLSFLGWLIFSVLTFGIGLLWIIPYITQTLVWFYLAFIPETSENQA